MLEDDKPIIKFVWPISNCLIRASWSRFYLAFVAITTWLLL